MQAVNYESNLQHAVIGAETNARYEYFANFSSVNQNPMDYFSVGTAVGQEAYYSKNLGIWMGKDFKIRGFNFNGNGATGGRNMFGKRVSTYFKWAGWGLAAYSSYITYKDYKHENINSYEFFSEEISNVISVAGREYGAAIGIGWSLGHIITKTDSYQNMKFNSYYNKWENTYGKPSDYNKELWEYFYKNYKP